MVKFIDINPADIDTARSGRRGRVSYPIIKAFMERNVKVSKIDPASHDKNPQYLRSVLTSYIRTHNMPIKLFSANGDLHLMRLDLDNNGNKIERWQEEHTTEGAMGHERDLEPQPLTPNTVKERFEQESKESLK